MPSGAQAQVSFVAQTHSQAWIAQETGIPRSTIGFVLRGERDLPDQYQSAMRNLYQRDAYARMKEVGFSANQANRFRSYAPATVMEYMSQVQDKIQDLAIGLAAMLQEEDEESGIYRSIDDYMVDAIDSITDGFRNSIKPKEDWDAYGEDETG